MENENNNNFNWSDFLNGFVSNEGNSIGSILGGVGHIIDAKTPDNYNTYVETSRNNTGSYLLIGGVVLVIVLVAVFVFKRS
ncbi:MAG TPA: hypothetical protein PLL02_00960 [Bacteroidales bacterium]|nr:hypothetical protein [Bacteroidales bacterium]